jgi:hypothetical protein
MIFKTCAEIVPGVQTMETPDRLINYYEIKKIEQYQGLGYEEMADRVAVVMRNPELRLNADLLVDGTGVGDAAVELMRKKGLYPIPIIFSGGEAPREHYSEFGGIFKTEKGSMSGAKVLQGISVPKKDLVAAGKVMLQQGRLRVAPGRWKETFLQQLQKFRGKVNEETRRVKYEAEMEQDHDDLVVCYLMGAWWITNRKGQARERVAESNETAGWEPDDYC